jgi:YfiH family protein
MLIEAPELGSLPGIRHAFFTREGGASAGLYESLNGGLGSSDDPAKVRENRRRMTGRLGFQPDALVSLHQIHSADAIAVERPWDGQVRPRADGMVTKVAGLVLGITTADCGPILFADAEARVIGAAHAGWRGALGGIVEATLAAMEKLGAERGRAVAVLGPMIRQDAYEVGPELVGGFREADPQNARFFRPSPRNGHAMFDLPGYLAARLRQAGVGTVADLGLCTYADERRFFSYRRATHRGEPDYGRLISAIALIP